ncbi:MAG: DUF2953 domain-containing protein [Firmicutes bacterium]|nr:DUF2953 domain-containing protein [Bacillota bacterium]
MLILALLLILLFTLLAFFWLKLEIGVFFVKEGSADQGEVFLAIPPLFKKRFEIPVVELVEKHGSLASRLVTESEEAPSWEKVTSLAQGRRSKLLTLGSGIAPRLHIEVRKLSLTSRIGLGDPALTGVGIGFIWMLLFNGLALAQRVFTGLRYVREPRVSIVPVYDGWHFEGRLECILSLRLGEIIVEGVKSLVSRGSARRSADGRTTPH